MKNEAASVGELQGRVAVENWSIADQTINVPQTRIFCGTEEVRSAQPLLMELSRRTGQDGAMDWLDFFLDSPDSRAKTPYLVLIGNGAGGAPDPSAASPDDLAGAVLLYEYRFAGFGTRVFATDDMIGIRTVIAPADRRMHVAHIAIRAMMQTGAPIVLVSVDSAPVGLGRRAPAEVLAYRLDVRSRWTSRHLNLGRTLEETLAGLGKHTRRNLRYYRRKLESEVGVEFVPAVQMQRSEFMDINRRSTNPAPERAANWYFDLIEARPNSPAVLFCGLRSSDGRWLSLAGGRRDDTATEIDWQLNAAGLQRYSLCTAMRSFIIENEIERGAHRLMFKGGTSHPMRFAFTEAQTTDLLAVRRLSVRAWLLRKLSRWVFPEKNFLGAALRDFRGEEPQSNKHRDSSDDLPYAA